MTDKLCKLLFSLAVAACTANNPAADDTTTPGDDDDTMQPDPQATIAIRDDGFVVLDMIRWTAEAAPTITGTVGDPATEIEVRAGGASLGKATVAGTTWTFAVPANTLGLAPTELTFVARVRAGAQVVLAQRYAVDATPPVLGAATSLVRDERTDVVSFGADGTILDHPHTGAQADLAGSGCPDVFKHAYLMEPNDANPIRWNLTATDDGVGIDPASAMIRIGREDGMFGPWVPTTGALAGTTTTFTFDAVRSGSTGVAFVASTEGKMVVQLSVKDRLGREVESERCWTNHPLAVPLLAGDPQFSDGHPLALLQNRLETGFLHDLAIGFINAGAPGLSMWDFDVFNGTQEAANVTFSLARPALTTRRDYVRQSALISVQTLSTSQRIKCTPTETRCDPPQHPNSVSSIGSTLVETADRFGVRVVRVNADGTNGAEIPCTPCDFAGGAFTFALPGKAAAGAPGVRYRVMTGAREIQHWAPSGAPGDNAAGPFADQPLVGNIDITGGLIGNTYKGCTHTTIQITNGIETEFCDEISTFQHYRALTRAEIGFTQPLANHVASSPAAGVPARSLGRLAAARIMPSFFYASVETLPPRF